MPVPNTFANATTSIPLSQLDQNFATAITLGNTAIQLGNTVTTLNNMTLANVTVSTGNVTVTSISGAFNGTVGATTANTGAFTTITSTGEAAIGGSSQQVKINRASDATAYGAITFNNDFGSTTMAGLFGRGSGGDSGKLFLNAPTGQTIVSTIAGSTVTSVSSTGLAVTGTLSCTGALSKGSGSFRITHPLPELSQTHQLVHSFIEGPKADLIYRGKVNLVNGTATVNIDEAAGMTDGTFVVLCRDVQCFTTNESDWTPVRGSVVGNVLTIEAQDNTSTASVSWMVIGERKDQHMYDTDWTDNDGRVIVEPIKPVVVEVTE
jgi:hypothetical protein